MSTLTREEQLAPYTDLRADRERSRDPVFVCEGALCVERAFANDFVVESVLTIESQLEELRTKVGAKLDRAEIILTTSEQLHEITGFKFHRGILAAVRRPPLGELEASRLIARERSLLVACEQLTDPANMGALIRNCRSFGADGLLLDQSSADPFSRRAVRTAMGNGFSLPLWRTTNLVAALQSYKNTTGGEVWAAALTKDAVSLRTLARPRHVLVLVGSEGEGLTATALSAADQRVIIPMSFGADSLNVAAASAVLLYQLSADEPQVSPARRY